MGKRKISVEEFTNDVLAGMTDGELMTKYRISRRHLDGMFAKLLQRGALQPSDLGVATQKSLEPTLELALTCPECGALNLFGSVQCPECGHSRITKHFKAIDTQETRPLPSETQAGIPRNGIPDRAQTTQAEREATSSPQEEGQERPEDRLHAPSPPSAVKPRPRKAFLYLAAATLVVVAGVVVVGLYTQMVSLPFGLRTLPPEAGEKPDPGTAPPTPTTKRVAAKQPAPKAARTEPSATPAPDPKQSVQGQSMPFSVDKPQVVEGPGKPAPQEAPTETLEPFVKDPDVRAADTSASGPVPEHDLSHKVEIAEAGQPKAQEPSRTDEEPGSDGNNAKPPQEDSPRIASAPPRTEPASPPSEAATYPKGIDTRTGSPDGAAFVDPRAAHETQPSRLRPPASEGAAHDPQEIVPAKKMEHDLGPLLLQAVKNKDVETVNLALNAGADPDSTDHEHTTALMYAARTRCLACVAALLNRGADVRRTDSRGDTALDMARRAGRIRAAELIVAHDPEKGPAALLIASQEGLADVVQVLLDNGVDVNSADSEGNTALIAASARGNRDIVGMLLKQGADVRARNKQGQTALTVITSTDSSRGGVPTRIRRELVRMLSHHHIPAGNEPHLRHHRNHHVR